MNIEGSLVYCILSQEFSGVAYERRNASLRVDHPLSYDPQVQMDGHIVLFAKDAAKAVKEGGPLPSNALYVCQGRETPSCLVDADCPTVRIRERVSLRHASNILALRLAALDRWDGQMRELVEGFAGFQAMLDASVEMMGYPCAIIDRQYRVLHRSTESEYGEQFSLELAEGADSLMADSVDLMMATPGYRRMRASKKPFPVPGSNHLMMRNLFWDASPVGALVFYRPDNAADARFARYMLEHLAAHLEAAYARIGSFGAAAATPSLLHATIKRALEGQAVDYGALARMLLDDDHEQGTFFELIQLERSFTNEEADEREYLVHRMERLFPRAYCIAADGALFALVDVGANPRSDPGTLRRDLPTLLQEVLAKAGTSRPFPSIDFLPNARRQTEAALAMGERVSPTYWCYRFEDYAMEWVLQHGVGDAPAECFADPALLTLRAFDAQHGTQLLRTLHVFMACRYNASLAASELFVARSTLLNRLERIRELTRLDLDDLSERTYLGMSFKLLGM